MRAVSLPDLLTKVLVLGFLLCYIRWRISNQFHEYEEYSKCLGAALSALDMTDASPIALSSLPDDNRKEELFEEQIDTNIPKTDDPLYHKDKVKFMHPSIDIYFKEFWRLTDFFKIE